MPSNPRYEVGDRLLLNLDNTPPIEVVYRGVVDGCTVVVMNGYQFVVDPQRLSAQSPDEEDDL